MAEKNMLSVPAFREPFWGRSTNSIWLATTLSLRRNIDTFRFPQKLEAAERRLVLDLVHKSIQADPEPQALALYPEDQLSPLDRDYLLEHFLVFSVARNFQHDQALVADAAGNVLVQVNVQDHLEFCVLESTGELDKALGDLLSLERRFERHLPFAFSKQFGFVTSDPCLSGTGLVVQAYVHIPALVQRGNWLQTVTQERQSGLSFTSLQGGGPDSLLGDVLVVSNRWTAGVTEESIVSSVYNAVLKLVGEEESIREKIRAAPDEEIVDGISRAIGTVQHAYRIDTGEALSAISLVKFGLELGWLTGTSIPALNALFLECRRAHLAKKVDPGLYASPQLYRARACYLRGKMASVAMKAM